MNFAKGAYLRIEIDQVEKYGSEDDAPTSFLAL
jgi:hypothetical protein